MIDAPDGCWRTRYPGLDDRKGSPAMDVATSTTPDVERWAPTLVYPASYRVSATGVIESVERDVEDAHGRQRHYRARRLAATIGNHGYPTVTLSGGRVGRRRTVCVHVLVKEAFHGPTPDGQEVLHVDGDPLNCHLSNLKFGTSAQNKADIARHGRNYWSNRTLCDYGHLLDGVNVVRHASDPRRRRCVACHRARGVVDHLRRNRRDANFREIADRKYVELTGLAPAPHRREPSARLTPRASISREPIPNLPREKWEPVIGWEADYRVSNLGRVKSLDRWPDYSDGRERFQPGKLLKGTPDRNGYPVVGLPDGTRRSGTRLIRVHLLVMRAFVGETPTGREVLHKDGDPGNATLANLRFGSHAENGADMVRHRRTPRDRQGDRCPWGHTLAAPNLVKHLLPATRKCLACTRAWTAEHAARRRGKTLDHQATSDRKLCELMGEQVREAPRRAERCIRGHLLAPENLVRARSSPTCLACNRARGLVRHYAKRGVVLDLDSLADAKYREIADAAGLDHGVGVGTAA